MIESVKKKQLMQKLAITEECYTKFNWVDCTDGRIDFLMWRSFATMRERLIRVQRGACCIPYLECQSYLCR